MKTISKPRVGVIGVGHLGQHHAKHFSQISSADFVGVYDADSQRGKEIADKYHTNLFNSQKELLNACDAVSVVTPTVCHAVVSEQCIKAGKHVFIEKPITETVEEADRLIALAKKQGVQIQVGHIERLNPALRSLRGYSLNPKYIEVQRLAPYTARGTDVPVVLDLMIHDIDIVLALVNSPVKNIRASGVSIMTDSVDIANARIRFENGTVASMTSSRIAKDKVRKTKIFQKDMYVTIDFLLGLTELYRVASEKNNKAILTAPLSTDDNQREIIYEKPIVVPADAMKLELANFIESIRGEETPIVDGAAGREALDVAVRIHDMILEDIH